MTVTVNTTWTNTIYNVLAKKLGREPTHEELDRLLGKTTP